MKLLSRDNPVRPLLLACLLFIFIGHVFYLAACFMPTPRWGRELMIWTMPVVQGLDTAARVAVERQADPFPAQVVILYCAVGAMILAGWGLFDVFSHRGSWRLRASKTGRNGDCKFKLEVFYGLLFSQIVSLLLFGAVFFVTVIEMKWLWHGLYSSSIGSVSFLLIYSVLTSYGLVTSPISFLYAVEKPIDKK